MANYNELLMAIKNACKDQMSAMSLANVCVGTVVSANPLKIQIEQKFVLGASNLVLPKHLTNYSVSAVIDGATKQITINNGLKVSDKVFMVMAQSGQKYFIIDKVA